MREVHDEAIDSIRPGAILGARDFALPFEHIGTAV